MALHRNAGRLNEMNSIYKQLWGNFDGSSLSFPCFRKSTPQENPSIDDGTFMVPEEIENLLSNSYKCRKEKGRYQPLQLYGPLLTTMHILVDLRITAHPDHPGDFQLSAVNPFSVL